MKICVPIRATNMKDFLGKLKQIQNYKKVDLIEIWLDQIDDLNLETIFKVKKKPLIGKFITHSKKIGILTKFIELGGEFIDLSDIEDFQYFNDLKKQHKFQIIGSFHDFIQTPALQELEELIKHCIDFQCDIIKIATMIQKKSDLNVLENCVDMISKFAKKAIVIGMGDLGRVTRFGLGVFKDNFLTFVALNNHEKTAEGQITLDEC